MCTLRVNIVTFRLDAIIASLGLMKFALGTDVY